MAIRKRGNCYQVSYRCPGEKSPRTETFKSEDEAVIREMQIKLAKKNGTFEPPIRISKGCVQVKRDITVSDFLDEYVEVYGLKKVGQFVLLYEYGPDPKLHQALSRRAICALPHCPGHGRLLYHALRQACCRCVRSHGYGG